MTSVESVHVDEKLAQIAHFCIFSALQNFSVSSQSTLKGEVILRKSNLTMAPKSHIWYEAINLISQK